MKSKDVTYPLRNKSHCDNVTLKFLGLKFCNGIKQCRDIFWVSNVKRTFTKYYIYLA